MVVKFCFLTETLGGGGGQREHKVTFTEDGQVDAKSWFQSWIALLLNLLSQSVS